jgi:hypothetical protein
MNNPNVIKAKRVTVYCDEDTLDFLYETSMFTDNDKNELLWIQAETDVLVDVVEYEEVGETN